MTETTSSPIQPDGTSTDPPRIERDTRFQKGQSGNPSGRPKTPETNIATELRKLLASDLQVQTPRGQRRMSREEAFVRRIVTGALKCERKAFRQFIKLAREAGELKDLRPPHNPIVEVDAAVLDAARWEV
jgi:hypothetical protein